ncbi:MAG: hypothetical protein SOR91_03985 [Hornefia butyriciproducens]|uniref:hypothetical protein n=1 Tax=Hornefia butyriciproducens TaxID=2652293 RepID=UPI002A7520B2|nr:hypothetical protein [Hornefia butyriciproducens]MDY2990616.1 hypothetical protein [Hornefia butyriciproducens]
MSERIEKLIREYPKKKRDLECLKRQIADFKGITDEDMIDVMYFSHPEGERVQTSGVSDKTARIAVTYKDKMERINSEWYEHLEKEYYELDEEVRFFESALKSLPDELSDVMTDMIIYRYTWDSLCSIYHVSRTMIAKYRRKAIRELEDMYQQREKEMVEYMLS